MRVFIIAALTADGCIAHDAEQLSTEWTSDADRRSFVKLTKQAGVIVMGSRTFATIGRALPGRRMIVYTHRPESIQVEGVETTHEAPRDLLARLEADGHNAAAICGGASIYSLFLEFVDELYLTIEPRLFGSGVTLLTGPVNVALRLLEYTALSDQTIQLHYEVQR